MNSSKSQLMLLISFKLYLRNLISCAFGIKLLIHFICSFLNLMRPVLFNCIRNGMEYTNYIIVYSIATNAEWKKECMHITQSSMRCHVSAHSVDILLFGCASLTCSAIALKHPRMLAHIGQLFHQSPSRRALAIIQHIACTLVSIDSWPKQRYSGRY